MKVRMIVVALFCVALLASTAAAAPRPIDSAAMPSMALPQGHDWEHDPRLEGRSAAHRQGFRDGSTDGERDRERNRPWHYGPGWKHPDRGYRPEFGDRRDYMREYKEGYERGYKEGYGERR